MTWTTWLVRLSRGDPHRIKPLVDRLGAPSLQLHDIVEDGSGQPLPSVAVLVETGLTPGLLEALRWLGDRQVPSLALVEGLTTHQEALILGAGAFDVVGLPNSEERLVSRVSAILRNARGFVADLGPSARAAMAETGQLPILRRGRLTIDLHSRRVDVAGVPVVLTRSEFDLLVALAEDADRVMNRRELHEAYGGQARSRSALESHLSRLRSKLAEAGAPGLVESVRGFGYRLGASQVRNLQRL